MSAYSADQFITY